LKTLVSITIICLACCANSIAQKKVLLTIICKDSSIQKGFKMPTYQKKLESAILRTHEMQQVLFALYDEAYLTASFDSLVQDSVNLTAFVTLGNRYEWAYLNKGNTDEGVLSQSGYRDKLFFHKPFYYKNVLKVMNKVLSIYENHGYPFAQIKLDSIKFSSTEISAALMVQKKEVEKIDSIIVKGDLKLAPQYLYGYLGIKPGDFYDESKVRAVRARLKALPFLFETKAMQVIFVKGKVKILLYLGKKSADQFNGIIGILPNNTTGQITITGDVSLQLQNSFHRAEEIGFQWQHIQAQTENLNLHFAYPYLFTTPIGVVGDLKLFKQDTTYLQVDSKIGLQYLLIGGNYWKAFYENISSSLLSTSTLQNQTTGLPPYADVTTQLYGLEYKANGLDYIYNPRSGYDILVSAAVGSKTIHQNSRLNPQIYDGLQLNSTEYRANLKAEYYIPFIVRAAFKLEVQAAYINAPSLLLNDMYRIGGFSILRGFDEQSIYASAYSVGTVEFHYLLEQNSFLFLFFDQGWYQEQATISNTHDTPYGFGAGMNFQTKAGIFSISYALGKEFNNPIILKDGKISFGIVNNF
jgi:outer membrane protein assembly factor BamA